jgi:uncharacterized RDD family membrane protein YckC
MTTAVSTSTSPIRRIHNVRTPEGISVPFEVAPVGDRVKAFLIDFFLLCVGSVLIGVLGLLSLSVGWLGIGVALLAHFILWNLYFILCEVNWGGRTVGKRVAGLRVISRDGSPLTAEAVFARNLMRDLEFFLPLAAMFAPQALIPDAPGWAGLVALCWLFVFAGMPLFNQDRLRCGDMIAGTLVVRAPVPVLLPDLADVQAWRRQEIAFTREQLDIYGIHELQVLEDLLHRAAEGTLDSRILEDVGEKIKRKVGWPQERWNVPTLAFLEAFYAAQRGRLEQRLLFGERRERKSAQRR